MTVALNLSQDVLRVRNSEALLAASDGAAITQGRQAFLAMDGMCFSNPNFCGRSICSGRSLSPVIFPSRNVGNLDFIHLHHALLHPESGQQQQAGPGDGPAGHGRPLQQRCVFREFLKAAGDRGHAREGPKR